MLTSLESHWMVRPLKDCLGSLALSSKALAYAGQVFANATSSVRIFVMQTSLELRSSLRLSRLRNLKERSWRVSALLERPGMVTQSKMETGFPSLGGSRASRTWPHTCEGEGIGERGSRSPSRWS